jgi:putative peptidoglycan lipid II flippase
LHVSGGAPATPERRGRRSLAATVAHAAPWQAASRASTALLPILVASWFGRSAATDLYNLLTALFVLAGSMVFGCFQDSALVPIVVDVERREPAQLPRLAGALYAYTAVIATALAAAIGAGVWLWFRARLPGAPGPLLAVMAVGFALHLPLLALRSLSAALLAARFSFVPDAIAGAAGVAVTLVVAASCRGLGPGVVPLAIAGGELVAVVLLLAAVRRSGLRVAPTWERPAALARFVRLVGAEIGGAAVVRVNPVIDQMVAQALGVVGGGTMLRLAGDLAGAPAALLGATFLSALLSHLAAAGAEGRRRDLRRTVIRSTLLVAGALAVAAAAMFLARVPLVRVVYGRGAMDAAALARIAHILPYHLIGLPPFGIILVLARAHVSLGNSRILVRMGVLSAASNLVLNLALARFLGLEGVALATSLVNVVVATAFWVRFRARLRERLLQRLRA